MGCSESGFPAEFIKMVQVLYVKSTVQVNVNSVLTESFEISRSVKQGCPLSATLYVLAISPLITRINNDDRINGCFLGDAYRVAALAYADDVTVIIQNQSELDTLKRHLVQYEQASGAKLNQIKTEGVWIGSDLNKTDINFQVKKEI